MVAPHYRVLVLSEAFSDLHKILDHIAAESPANAAAVVGQLWEALHSLAEFPHRYAI
jgi:plasmid stabilization system protein ParE